MKLWVVQLQSVLATFSIPEFKCKSKYAKSCDVKLCFMRLATTLRLFIRLWVAFHLHYIYDLGIWKKTWVHYFFAATTTTTSIPSASTFSTSPRSFSCIVPYLASLATFESIIEACTYGRICKVCSCIQCSVSICNRDADDYAECWRLAEPLERLALLNENFLMPTLVRLDNHNAQIKYFALQTYRLHLLYPFHHHLQ